MYQRLMSSMKSIKQAWYDKGYFVAKMIELCSEESPLQEDIHVWVSWMTKTSPLKISGTKQLRKNHETKTRSAQGTRWGG